MSYFRSISLITILVIIIETIIIFERAQGVKEDAPPAQVATKTPWYAPWRKTSSSQSPVTEKIGLTQRIRGLLKKDPVYINATWNALQASWHTGAQKWRGGWVFNRGYKNLPMTEDDAKAQHWVKIDEHERCEGGEFPGFRYAKKVKKVKGAKKMTGDETQQYDPSVILIFDKNGYIAGIQSWIPKDTYQPDKSDDTPKTHAQIPHGTLQPDEPKVFVPVDDSRSTQWYVRDNTNGWTKTVYFVNPTTTSTICTHGRSEAEFKKGGTGSKGLWIRTNRNEDQNKYKRVEMDEPAPNLEHWTKGKCVKTMGQHYWYDDDQQSSPESKECKDFSPICLLYNKGKLTGMCLVNPVHLTGEYFDSKKKSTTSVYATLSEWMDPAPQCFKDDPRYSQMTSVHFFFKENYVHNSNCDSKPQEETNDNENPPTGGEGST